jgi:dihydroneopterin aldolase
MLLHSGADIIDCKDPSDGALGALPPETIRLIVAATGGNRPVSATTGNLDGDTRLLRNALSITADCGVDYIKFGLSDATSVPAQMLALRKMAKTIRLIAVCFADRYDAVHLLPCLADAGLHGVMVDTNDKRYGSLTEIWSCERIAAFVYQAHELGLICGLAGRLGLDDIPALLPCDADYLGFRSALCGGDRNEGLDDAAVARIREAIPYRPARAGERLMGWVLH